jgi:thiol:disulfide interchange protein DsbD
MTGLESLPRDVGVLSVWLMGVSVGLTACTAVCLPFMGTWAVGRGGGGRGALVDTGAFVAGKLAAYTLLGGLAGLLGETVAERLEGSAGHLAIGLASLLAGLWLLWPARAGACGMIRGGRMPPFALGVALSLVPCAPLAALLAVAALAADPGLGLAYGLAFGLGAALTPLFVVVPALGVFGRLFGDGRPRLARFARLGAGLVLVALGLRRLWLLF